MLVYGVVVFASGIENCMVFARNLTKCGNKGKKGRQATLHSLVVGRCAGAQGPGGPYHGEGGRLTRNTREYIL